MNGRYLIPQRALGISQEGTFVFRLELLPNFAFSESFDK
jgi:hypothetical protein